MRPREPVPIFVWLAMIGLMFVGGGTYLIGYWALKRLRRPSARAWLILSDRMEDVPRGLASRFAAKRSRFARACVMSPWDLSRSLAFRWRPSLR